ncbi:MAG TPA: GNAT family N-acetyltransferase [Candidatus Ozemobacteraceae bacterium]|nr:GNAT family N-acetyltransferase [Candidatus Ozemobacteraceae bacterium]
MNIKIQHDCGNIDWEQVRDSLKRVGMAYREPEVHRLAFQGSFCKVFLFDEGRMIGFGRAISDGVSQAAVYDIVVLPEYQNKGIGKLLMNSLLEKLGSCNVILYANPGKEGFYATLGFRPMPTAMGRFLHPERMIERGMLR